MSPDGSHSEMIKARSVVLEELEKAGWDYEAALQPLLKRVHHSATLTEEILREGCRYLARVACSERRSQIQTMSESNDSTPIASRAMTKAQHMKVAQEYWYQYPLPGNHGLLGNATRATIKSVVEFHAAQEAGNRRERKFLEAVGKKLTDDKQRVQDVLSNAALKKLRGETK